MNHFVLDFKRNVLTIYYLGKKYLIDLNDEDIFIVDQGLLYTEKIDHWDCFITKDTKELKDINLLFNGEEYTLYIYDTYFAGGASYTDLNNFIVVTNSKIIKDENQ